MFTQEILIFQDALKKVGLRQFYKLPVTDYSNINPLESNMTLLSIAQVILLAYLMYSLPGARYCKL